MVLFRPLTVFEDQPRLASPVTVTQALGRQDSASEVAHSIKINKSIATENQYCPCNALKTIQKCSLHCAHRDISSRIKGIILWDMNLTFRHSNCQILLLDLETSVDLTLFT